MSVAVPAPAPAPAPAPVSVLVLLAALVYVATVTLAGAFTPGYDPTRQLISELGQVGAPYAAVMQVMLIGVGLTVVGFAASTRSVLLATIGAGLVLGGVFRCDELCKPHSFSGWAHILTSIPATLASLVAPFVFARKLPASRWFGVAAILALLAAILVFPPLGIPGIGQRIATAIPLAWVAWLAVALPRSVDRFPPGPSGWSALRYLGWKRDLLDFTARCRRDFGGLCGLRLPGVRACLVSDPALIDEVFVKHAARIKKWDAGQFALLLGKGLLTSDGELWRRQRSLIQKVFAASRNAEHTERILAEAERMLARWPKAGVIDVHSELMRASLKIAAGALFGADCSAVEDLIEEMQHELMTQFEAALSGVPLPMWLPTPQNLRTRRAIRRLDAAILGLIAQRREGAPANDFLGALLAARDDDGTGMTDRQLRDECVTMILAGHETTAVTLTWTLHLVAQHPGTYDLRHLLEESMRVFPPVWAIGRVTTCAITLGEHELPAGTQLFLLPYLAHRDEANFADATAFRPERWEGAEKPAKGAYLPFGAGPRKCVGMHFAMHEMTLLLGAMLARYRFAPTADAVVLQPSVTLRPRGGLRLSVEAR